MKIRGSYLKINILFEQVSQFKFSKLLPLTFRKTKFKSFTLSKM